MFGYVNINRNGLSEEELRDYRGYYCGLCSKLKEIGGKKAQFLLNFDITFMIILLSGLYEPEEEAEYFTCPVHPAKKRLKKTDDITEYGAWMDILLSYHSLMDDWYDEKNRTKKSYADGIRPLYEHAAEKYTRQEEAVRTFMEKTRAAEEAGEENVDAVSALTGDMLAELFVISPDVWENDLRNVGYYLGRYIYLLDAFCDLEKDRRKKNYNPLLLGNFRSAGELTNYTRQKLTSYISQAARSFERMPILKNAEIIRNILYSGVWTRFDVSANRYTHTEEKLQKKQKKEPAADAKE